MESKPSVGVAAADNVLQLLAMLARERSVRVIDVATELGVGRSTAHRLLSTLAARDFVEQAAGRRYEVGPALRRLAAQTAGSTLPEIARPHMTALSRQTGETVNLSVLVGRVTRFVESVEGTAALRVGGRLGVSLPAEHTSGGKVLLAELEPEALDAVFPDAGEALHRSIALARRRGYGLNVQETEDGITAIGVAVRDAHGTAVAALSVAAPAVRYGTRRILALLPPLRAAAERIRVELR